jgi:hypothetical protein
MIEMIITLGLVRLIPSWGGMDGIEEALRDNFDGGS